MPKSDENSHLQRGAAAADSSTPRCTQRRGADLLLHLTVQPRATPEGFGGIHANRLRLRVGAAPVDDAANARVVSLLSELLDMPRGAIRIVRGQRSRNKDVLLRDAGAQLGRIASLTGISAPAAGPDAGAAADAQTARRTQTLKKKALQAWQHIRNNLRMCPHVLFFRAIRYARRGPRAWVTTLEE